MEPISPSTLSESPDTIERSDAVDSADVGLATPRSAAPQTSPSRFKTALGHLTICAVIGLALFLLFWIVLYPAPLFQAVGVLEIFLMLLAIDVVLGPLLTLIVWKADWKHLRKDLAVIAFVQLAAMAYGLYTLWIARPVYLAALGHRFDVVHASEIPEGELEASGKALPLFGPEWVGTKMSTDPKEKDRVMMSSIGGVDYGHYPKHHQPIENMRDEILKNAQSIAELKKVNPNEAAAIDRWIEKRGMKPEDVRFQGLKARGKDITVFLDAKTAKVIGIASFNPWP